jgi:hypothetical protein
MVVEVARREAGTGGAGMGCRMGLLDGEGRKESGAESGCGEDGDGWGDVRVGEEVERWRRGMYVAW